jgi:hypothetical protein
MLPQYVFWLGSLAHITLLTSILFFCPLVLAEALVRSLSVYFGSVRSQYVLEEWLRALVSPVDSSRREILVEYLSLVSISISFYTMIKSSTPSLF